MLGAAVADFVVHNFLTRVQGRDDGNGEGDDGKESR
jgi:hypothetical protein